MAEIRHWENTGAGNDKGSPPDYPVEGYTYPSINDTAREGMAVVRRWYEDAEWVWGFPSDDVTVAVLSTTQFRLSGDQTAEYVVGRRVRAVGTVTGTIYGAIDAALFTGGNTDVTVIWDSSAMVTEAMVVHVGILKDRSSSSGTRTTATSNAPDETFDSAAGYKFGDVVFAAETLAFHTCYDATPGAAQWVQDGLAYWDTGQFTYGVVAEQKGCRWAANWGAFAAANEYTFRPVPGPNQIRLYKRLGFGGQARKWVDITAEALLVDATKVTLGEGGLDTGAWAAKWYRIFVVAGSTGVGLVATVAQTTDSEPDWTNLAGYDRWYAPVGYVRHTGAGTFESVAQFGLEAQREAVSVATGTFITPTPVALADYMPPAVAVQVVGLAYNQSGLEGILRVGSSQQLSADDVDVQMGTWHPGGAGSVRQSLSVPVDDRSFPVVRVSGVNLVATSEVFVRGWTYTLPGA